MLELRDPVSSASHLLTAIWAVYATLIMWRMSAQKPERVFPVIVYGASMVLLFLASGLFHGLHYTSAEQKRLFQKIDQSAVYLLIAGTYTPVLWILLQGGTRRWFLRVVWALAFAGVGCMWLLPKAPHAAIVGIYLGVGWAGIFPLPVYYRVIGWRPMNYVLVGALCYTACAVCELTDWPVIVPGWIHSHEVLHFFVSLGNLVYFLFVIRYVIPFERKHETTQIAQTFAK